MSRPWSVVALVALVVGTGVLPAHGQGVGFQGGGTASPTQFYVGSHLEVPLGADTFVLRPSIEGGSGEGLVLASLNFEFLYRYWLPGDRWAIYQGTGPAVNFFRLSGDDQDTTVRGGLNFVFGVRHRSGFFSELKIGGSGSPNLRYGAGYTVAFGGRGGGGPTGP